MDEAEVNLTPLIDVVFVMLIMFMVIAPLLEKEEVDLAQGPPLSTEQVVAVESQSPLTIHVHANDTISFNHTPVSLQQLAISLQAAYAQYPDVQPQLFQDEKARFGTYQEVKNRVAEAGFETLDVILKP